MPSFCFGGTRRRRPSVAYGINWDFAQELGVLRWYPLSNGVLFRDFKSGNLLTPTAPGTLGTRDGWGAAGFAGTSYLDGNAVTELSGAGEFTVHAWCATNVTSSSGGGGGLRYIVSNEISGTWQFFLRYAPPSGFLAFGIFAGGGFTATGTTTVTANRTMAVTGRFEGSAINVWRDGRQEGSTAIGTTAGVNTTNIVTIGSDSGFNSRLRQWSGWISDVVIASKPWSAGQIWTMSQPDSAWQLYWQPSGIKYFHIAFPRPEMMAPAIVRGIVPSGPVQ